MRSAGVAKRISNALQISTKPLNAGNLFAFVNRALFSIIWELALKTKVISKLIL